MERLVHLYQGPEPGCGIRHSKGRHGILRGFLGHPENLQEQGQCGKVHQLHVQGQGGKKEFRLPLLHHPYEALKALTRTNKKMSEETIHEFVQTLNVSDAVKAELMAITPHNYTGI